MATKNIYWGYSTDGTTLRISSTSSSPATNLWVQDDTYAINRDYANMKPPWKAAEYSSMLSTVTKFTFNGPPAPYYTYLWFSDFESVVSPGTININMKNVIDSSDMFSGMSNLTTLALDTTNFCINKLVHADYMFMGCTKLSSLTTTAACWTTTNPTLESAEGMFEFCFGLSDFSFLKNIKTANLKYANYMLGGGIGSKSGATKVSVNLTGWDLTSASNWDSDIFNCGIDLFDDGTPVPIEVTVTNMILGPNSNRIFGSAQSINSIVGLDSVDASALTDMSGMFYGFSRFDTGSVDIDLTSWDVSNVATAFDVFSGNKNCNFNISNMIFNGLTSSCGLFGGITSTCLLDATETDVSYATSYKFAGSNMDNIITTKTKWSDHMTSAEEMFYGTSNFSSSFLNNFNFSNVTTAESMFSDSKNIKFDEIILSNCNFSSLESAKEMFGSYIGYGSTVKYIDITALSTSPLTNVDNIFNSCTYLKTIYTGGALIDWSSKNCYHAFYNCTSLVGGNGTVYDSSNVNASYARCDLVKGNAGITADQKGYFSAALTMNHCLA